MTITEVVTVGGGSGSPVMHDALFYAGVEQVHAIVTLFDSGGATGRRRLESYGREPAYSDGMRCMLSLVHPEQRTTPAYQTLRRFLMHRDERDHVLGQEIFHQFYSQETGFQTLMEMFTTFGVNFMGEVLPSSVQPANIGFSTLSGRNFHGEHHLDDLRMADDPVTDMWLEPSVQGYQPAIETLRRADRIILSCGSIHGSVLVNFLPDEMAKAIQESPAKMYLVTNLVSTMNETHNFSPQDFVDLVQKYTGRRLDGLLIPDMSREEFESQYKDVANFYTKEHSYFLGWDESVRREMRASGIEIITHQATTITTNSGRQSVIRHDPQQLAIALQEIL